MSETNAEQAAWDELDRLTDGSPGKLWRWSIPADPERDSDLILAAGLKAVATERDEAHTGQVDLLRRIVRLCRLVDLAAASAEKVTAERDAALAKADGLEEAAAHLSAPGRVWHGDGGVTVMLDDERMTRQPLTAWLCARAYDYRAEVAK